MRVYISGPISGLSQQDYTDNFGRAEAMLLELGHEPINPLKVPACEDEDCNTDVEPVKEDGTYLHTWECYLRFDLKAMLDCEGIVMIEGWTESRGALFELDVAKKCGFKVALVRSDYKGFV